MNRTQLVVAASGAVLAVGALGLGLTSALSGHPRPSPAPAGSDPASNAYYDGVLRPVGVPDGLGPAVAAPSVGFRAPATLHVSAPPGGQTISPAWVTVSAGTTTV